MENIRIQQNQSERFEAFFTNTAGTPLSGLTPALTIRRQSDGLYWTGNQDFTSVFTQVTMSAVNATNIGGLYERTFDTTGLADATYTIIASGTGAGNSPQIGELKVGGFIDNLDASVRDMSNAVGGGTVITLDGALSKKDRKLLVDAIQDEFKRILDLLDMMKSAIDSLKSNMNPTEINLLSQKLDNLSQSITNSNFEKELEMLQKEVLNA